MVSRRLRYTWWAAPRSQVGPPTFQGTSREALCVHLCRLRGVVFSPGSSTYNREQEGSAAAILSRVPCPLLEPNRFFASCSSLFFPSLRMFVNGTSGERKFEGRKFGAFEREWCEERILIFSLAGTEVYRNNWAEEQAKVNRWTRVISNLESGVSDRNGGEEFSRIEIWSVASFHGSRFFSRILKFPLEFLLEYSSSNEIEINFGEIIPLKRGWRNVRLSWIIRDMRNLSVVVGKSWSAREKIDSCKAIDSSRKNNRFQEEEEEEDRLLASSGSHDGHRIGEDGQAEFGNVARLSIFTNDLIEEIGRSLDVRQNKESRLHPVCICTSRSTQFLPSFSSTEISVTWFFEKKKE